MPELNREINIDEIIAKMPDPNGILGFLAEQERGMVVDAIYKAIKSFEVQMETRPNKDVQTQNNMLFFLLNSELKELNNYIGIKDINSKIDLNYLVNIILSN